jgi:hypothetical protein
MKRSMVSRYIATGLAAIGVCIATGCATTDTVSSRFPQLQENINAAKAVDAELYAPTPLKSAEGKFAAAKAAVADNDMVAANRLVDEAMVDADYARAAAPTEKAKKAAMRLRQDILAVSDEIKKIPPVK